MLSINNRDHSSREPAKNYRKRARAVLERMLVHMKALADPKNWREPTEEEMENFIDNFHHILNWAVDGARRLGFPVGYYSGQLTEKEMRFVESRFLR